jgi:hypothetical protein
MRAQSGTPTLKVSQATGIEGESYQEVVESPFPATSKAQRQRFRCFRDDQSLYLKVEQEGESSETEVFLVEVEHRSYGLPSEGESSASSEY